MGEKRNSDQKDGSGDSLIFFSPLFFIVFCTKTTLTCPAIAISDCWLTSSASFWWILLSSFKSTQASVM